MLRFFGQFFVKSEAKLDVLRMHIQPRERLPLFLGGLENIGGFWNNILKLTPLRESLQ